MNALESIYKITCIERKQIFDKINVLFKKSYTKLELLEEIMKLNQQEIDEYGNLNKEKSIENLVLDEIQIIEKYNKKYENLIKIYYKKQEEKEMNKIKTKNMII